MGFSASCLRAFLGYRLSFAEGSLAEGSLAEDSFPLRAIFR